MSGRERGSSLALSLGALGVVFGDIGTSPLYAMRSVLHDAGGTDRLTVYGMTSTLIWSMVVVVTALYVGLLLRADNEGEGGVLALVALLRRETRRSRERRILVFVGMAGAAMFLGDCVITPAISVLSAAEGLEVASPSLKVVVLPVALTLIVGVFVLQRVGSGSIGLVYGPVMVLWFLTLAASGTWSLVQYPEALQALSPHWAVRFFVSDPLVAFLSLGAVVLAVTGAEALYADLGHFGRPAITRSWLAVVFPALVLAYLGEAGAIVQSPSAVAEPFYAVIPAWATIPVLALATCATVIASEAVIAGAFTVLHQAGGLGLFPFLRTRHPSARHAGQIYVPSANWVLAGSVLAMVLLFRSSDKLASAYGVAVSATILATTFLYLALDHARSGGIRLRQVGGVLCGLVVAAFLAASLPKIASGGWAPVGIGLALVVVMWTWTSGRRRLAVARRSEEDTASDLLRDVPRTPGAAVFLTEDSEVAPVGLRALVETGQTLPDRVLLLSWEVDDTPTALAHATAVSVHEHDGLLSVHVSLGYRERLEVRHVLERAAEQEPHLLAGIDPETAFYVVSEPIPRLSRSGDMARWRQRVFLVIDRLATDRVEQMALPRRRTITVGRDFDL